jgi:hypothetical protein
VKEDVNAVIDAMGAFLAMERTPMDRYRDFRAVFGTDAGQRVLQDIMGFGNMFRGSVMGENSHVTYKYEGRRELALMILTTYTREPGAERPQQGRSKPEE